MCKSVLACMNICVLYTCLAPTEVRRRHWILWSWNYGCLWPIISGHKHSHMGAVNQFFFFFLWINSWSSARAANTQPSQQCHSCPPFKENTLIFYFVLWIFFHIKFIISVPFWVCFIIPFYHTLQPELFKIVNCFQGKIINLGLIVPSLPQFYLFLSYLPIHMAIHPPTHPPTYPSCLSINPIKQYPIFSCCQALYLVLKMYHDPDRLNLSPHRICSLVVGSELEHQTWSHSAACSMKEIAGSHKPWTLCRWSSMQARIWSRKKMCPRERFLGEWANRSEGLGRDSMSI